jgi:hypothetical protein
MTPLAIAHKALEGDLRNTCVPVIGDKFLYLHSNGAYITFQNKFNRQQHTYISTVEEFNNFKGDNMKVYTQEMADNGVLPSVGMEAIFTKEVPHTSVFCDAIGRKVKVLLHHGGCALIHWAGHYETFTASAFKPLTPPIELIGGEAYQFDFNSFTYKGIYYKPHDNFTDAHDTYEVKFCTNIQKLTLPKTKAEIDFDLIIDKTMSEMDIRFELKSNHDDSLVSDDTQLGVEFAVEFMRSELVKLLTVETK